MSGVDSHRPPRHCERVTTWARTIVEQGRAGEHRRVSSRARCDVSIGRGALVRRSAWCPVAARRRCGSVTPPRRSGRSRRPTAPPRSGSGDGRRRPRPPLRRRGRRGYAVTARPVARGRRHRRVPDRVPAPARRQLRRRRRRHPSPALHRRRGGVARGPARRRGRRSRAEHAKGDVAARGSASDLLLFLWGRVPADALEVFGDAACSARSGRRSGCSEAVRGASARIVSRTDSPRRRRSPARWW